MKRYQQEGTSRHHSLMISTLEIITLQEITTVMEDLTITQVAVAIGVLCFVVTEKRQDISGKNATS